MKPLPPLRALQVFETLGHCQNLNEAATRLQITSGAVSQQLKLLEAALGTALTYKGQTYQAHPGRAALSRVV